MTKDNFSTKLFYVKILLIEDEEFIRDIYTDELTNGGFQVDSVGTGREGFEKLAQNRYDLLLLDIMLPDTNGLEILKKVKQNPQTKDLKVVLLTNLGEDSVIKEGFKLGADKYLIKMSYNLDQVVQELSLIHI